MRVDGTSERSTALVKTARGQSISVGRKGRRYVYAGDDNVPSQLTSQSGRNCFVEHTRRTVKIYVSPLSPARKYATWFVRHCHVLHCHHLHFRPRLSFLVFSTLQFSLSAIAIYCIFCLPLGPSTVVAAVTESVIDYIHVKVNGKRSIAVRKKPHRYGNSCATWDHAVLPATRQR